MNKAQTFKLYNWQINDNLNLLVKNEILEKMLFYIKFYNLDISERHVARGSYGDAIVFENGNIDLIGSCD